MTLITHDPAGYAPRSATVTVPDDLARRIAADDWHISRTITQQQRDTFDRVDEGAPVPVGDLVDALVAAVAATTTRWGTSMRRRHGRAPLVETYAWLRGAAPDALVTLDAHDPTRRQPSPDIAARLQRAEDGQRVAVAQIGRLERDLEAARDVATSHATAYHRAAADRDHLDEQVRTLAARERGTSADVAAYHYALTLMTDEQRAKVDAFRTGFTVGRGSAGL